MDVVLIPCYNRPEFLALCLEHIQKANHADEHVYHFSVEHNHHPDILDVIAQFPLDKLISKRGGRFSKGNQHNVMEGYKEIFHLANELGSELIYNIEPDIWIAKGFFDFHRDVQKNDCFSASACRNQDNPEKVPQKDGWYTYASFQSLGISFKRKIVEDIVRHSNMEYYQNPVHYLDRLFPTSVRKGKHYEQAGLINRIREFNEIDYSIFPFIPLAYHAGFYGVNRKALELKGTTKEKIYYLRTMTDSEMNDRAVKYKDITSCDLEREWKN